jgi:hypothetical protein
VQTIVGITLMAIFIAVLGYVTVALTDAILVYFVLGWLVMPNRLASALSAAFIFLYS